MDTSTWLIIGTIAFVAILAIVARKATARPAFSEGEPEIEPPVAPPAREPMRMMRMLSTGFLRMEGPDGTHDEQLPASPHGHGEYPQGLWVSSEGIVYIVAKQYTGRPGPDDGVLFRRKPDGTWDTFYREESRFFCTVVGTNDGQLYVGSMRGYFYFNGNAWKFVPIDFNDRIEVFSRDGRIYGASNHRELTWILEGDVPTPSEVRLDRSFDERIQTENGVTYSAFHRNKPLGEVELDPAEEAEIRGELAQIQQLAREGKLETRKHIS